MIVPIVVADTLLSDLLEISARIARGEIPEYQHNECYTSGAFDLLLIHIHGPAAFDLLSQACHRYGEIKSTQSNLKGYFALLSELTANSRTTELPRGLREIIDENPELSHDLKRWYCVIAQ